MLEGIAYQVKDVTTAMVNDSGVPLSSMRVDGGVAMSDPLLQAQADLLGANVERPRNVETTALGAAYCAAVGAGVATPAELMGTRSSDVEVTTFLPEMDQATRSKRSARWKKAVDASLGWAADE